MEQNQQLLKTAARLEALGNETRLEVFQLLVQAGHSGIPVGQIQKQLEIPASTLSHHIARLVSAGLVHQERKSRSLICRADYSAMDMVIGFLTRNCCLLDAIEKEANKE